MMHQLKWWGPLLNTKPREMHWPHKTIASTEPRQCIHSNTLRDREKEPNAKITRLIDKWGERSTKLTSFVDDTGLQARMSSTLRSVRLVVICCLTFSCIAWAAGWRCLEGGVFIIMRSSLPRVEVYISINISSQLNKITTDTYSSAMLWTWGSLAILPAPERSKRYTIIDSKWRQGPGSRAKKGGQGKAESNS